MFASPLNYWSPSKPRPSSGWARDAGADRERWPAQIPRHGSARRPPAARRDHVLHVGGGPSGSVGARPSVSFMVAVAFLVLAMDGSFGVHLSMNSSTHIRCVPPCQTLRWQNVVAVSSSCACNAPRRYFIFISTRLSQEKKTFLIFTGGQSTLPGKKAQRNLAYILLELDSSATGLLRTSDNCNLLLHYTSTLLVEFITTAHRLLTI